MSLVEDFSGDCSGLSLCIHTYTVIFWMVVFFFFTSWLLFSLNEFSLQVLKRGFSPSISNTDIFFRMFSQIEPAA